MGRMAVAFDDKFNFEIYRVLKEKKDMNLKKQALT